MTRHSARAGSFFAAPSAFSLMPSTLSNPAFRLLPSKYTPSADAGVNESPLSLGSATSNSRTSFPASNSSCQCHRGDIPPFSPRALMNSEATGVLSNACTSSRGCLAMMAASKVMSRPTPTL